MRPIRLSTFATGFPRKYRSDEEELGVALGEAARARSGGLLTGDPENARQVWRPSTIDFQTEAKKRPPALGVASFDDLLSTITSHQNVIEVHWFGHGTPSGGFLFGQGAKFGPEDMKDFKPVDLSKHLARRPGITFFACNVGQSEEFIQALADALQVEVHAFKRPVEWQVKYIGESPNRKISYRGLAGDRLPVPTINKEPRATRPAQSTATPRR